MQQTNTGKWLLAAVLFLAAIFVAGGVYLLFGMPAPPTESAADIPAVTTQITTTSSTAAATVTTLTTTTSAFAATTTTTTTTTAPPLSPEESLYAQYLTDTLIPLYGSAQTFSPAENDMQTGIAAAFVRDLR